MVTRTTKYSDRGSLVLTFRVNFVGFYFVIVYVILITKVLMERTKFTGGGMVQVGARDASSDLCHSMPCASTTSNDTLWIRLFTMVDYEFCKNRGSFRVVDDPDGVPVGCLVHPFGMPPKDKKFDNIQASLWLVVHRDMPLAFVLQYVEAMFTDHPTYLAVRGIMAAGQLWNSSQQEFVGLMLLNS